MLNQVEVERLEAEAVNSAKVRQPLYAARKKIFPKRASGDFRRFKWLVIAITLGIFYLKPWIRSIELAACRAGLLVCGDITAASRMLAVDGRVVGGLSAADRIRDLVPFSISERCSKVRRAIGIGATIAR